MCIFPTRGIFTLLEEENVPLPDFDIKTNNNNVINEIFVTITEIVDILKIIDPYKASGPDKISHKMLKISPEKITIPLQIDIRLKYLFNKSHLSSSPYTISSKFSSFIEFRRGGIQLLPLFDLICIFIIFQYVFGLDEFSRTCLLQILI
jgi:hypothetical protein